MTTDWKSAQEATHPFERRRDVMARQHAESSAAPTPRTDRVIPPFVADPLRKCVCGARPRYGFEEHVKHCAVARMAAPPVVTAAEVPPAIEASLATDDPAPEDAGADVTCSKCGKGMKKRGAHFHIRACKG